VNDELTTTASMDEETRERTARGIVPPPGVALPAPNSRREMFHHLADVRLWQTVLLSWELGVAAELEGRAPDTLEEETRHHLMADAEQAWGWARAEGDPGDVHLAAVVTARMNFVVMRALTVRDRSQILPELEVIRDRLEEMGFDLTPPEQAPVPSTMREVRELYVARASKGGELTERFLAELLTPGWPHLELADLGVWGPRSSRSVETGPDREPDAFDAEGFTPIGEEGPQEEGPQEEGPRSAPALLTDAKAETFQRHLEAIAEQGWTLAGTAVPGVGTVLHTIGLGPRYQLPELAVTGLRIGDAYEILALVAGAIRDREIPASALAEGELSGGRLGDLTLRLVDAHPAWVGHPALEAIVEVAAELAMARPPRLRQVLVPHEDGSWPQAVLADPPA
jgi:hypothetical protein